MCHFSYSSIKYITNTLSERKASKIMNYPKPQSKWDILQTEMEIYFPKEPNGV